MLAGVSIDYYHRLEQGRDRHPSVEVVSALGRVFGLNDEEMAHLHELGASTARSGRATKLRRERLEPGLVQMLHSMADRPLLVQTRFRDVLGCTELALRMHPGLANEPNMLKLLFLNPAQREFYQDWEQVASEAVAWLRAAAGSDQDDPRLTRLVGELSVASGDFRRLWARQDVRGKSSGARTVRHPEVGRLTVHYETFAVHAVGAGQYLTVYYAEPDTPHADALRLLTIHGPGRVKLDVPGSSEDVILFT